MPDVLVSAPATQRPRLDRRSQRSRAQLRDALAEEILAAGDLSRVTVTAVTERAGLTRRTFYSHFHDIPDLVAAVEADALADVRGLVGRIAASSLDDLTAALRRLEPAPGAVELLCYFRDNAACLTALLGEGGDPAFVEKIKAVCCDAVRARALDGIDARAMGPFLDYYLAFAVSAEAGVLTRWLTGGMREDVHTMALMMTALTFVRPGDLYGKTIDLNVPAYALALMRSSAAGGDPATRAADAGEARAQAGATNQERGAALPGAAKTKEPNHD